MSETNTPTPDQIAERQKRADIINAKIAELRQFEGKTFERNDGKGLPIKVVRYAGIFQDANRAMVYTFSVETKGHAAWNAPASEFLANHHVVETTEANSAVNDLPI